MNTRVRCCNCHHLLPLHDRCTLYRRFVDYPRHWRRCDGYEGPLPLPETRSALADADLLRYVAELRDTTEGRLLRLRHNVPEQQRFAVYRLAGIRVNEPDPAIIGRSIKGSRKHGGRADESDPSQRKSRAA
ncbi:hypothetical protein [Halochromatium roseum]|uniref:hypothetical protein n=1 Tax=Halochromatium roseum TaxID=391920 RepID=UPI001914CF88|nr:hypothetical protein [Halochromatium roseum]MBK5938127.1 hypothetical protein [Halochromatium roseum]